MSNRDRVVEMITHDLAGTHSWLNHPLRPAHLCPNAPACGLPKDYHEARAVLAQHRAKADALFCRVVDDMDWNRVLMIAFDRHQNAVRAKDAALDIDPLGLRCVFVEVHLVYLADFFSPRIHHGLAPQRR